MGLRALLDRIEPLVHKGSRFEKLYPLYEAADTFLYRPRPAKIGRASCRERV